MFTLEQIKTAHSKVKSGADFPGYISEMKEFGIIAYEHFIDDGHIIYYGKEEFALAAPAKWASKEISAKGNVHMLQDDLTAHQAGKTDYLTFCTQAAEAGVDKWIVDMIKMTCIYYNKAGNEMLSEAIPA
jgi:uncharacterized protein YbcV (DUF1398 family)